VQVKWAKQEPYDSGLRDTARARKETSGSMYRSWPENLSVAPSSLDILPRLSTTRTPGRRSKNIPGSPDQGVHTLRRGFDYAYSPSSLPRFLKTRQHHTKSFAR